MESERETRKRRIDPRLEAAGWLVAISAQMTPETSLWPAAIPELPTLDGPADYALCVAQRIQAVVEAKKLTLGPQGVLPQAERYSRAIAAAAVPGRVRRAVPVLDQRRGDLVPRRSPRAEPLAPGLGLPHAGGACARCSTATSTPSSPSSATIPHERAASARTRSRRTRRSSRRSRPQAQDARDHGDRHRQDADDGQRDLPADEVRRRAARPVPRRPPGARRADRPGVRVASRPSRASSSTRSTRSTRQRFQRDDFGEDEKFDPNVMPNSLPHRPEARRRLRLRLARSSA